MARSRKYKPYMQLGYMKYVGEDNSKRSQCFVCFNVVSEESI